MESIRKRKAVIFAVFFVYAVPITLSVLHALGMLWILGAHIRAGYVFILGLFIVAFVAAYLVTYIVSLRKTMKAKALVRASLLPLLHIFLYFIILAILFVWEVM